MQIRSLYVLLHVYLISACLTFIFWGGFAHLHSHKPCGQNYSRTVKCRPC